MKGHRGRLLAAATGVVVVLVACGDSSVTRTQPPISATSTTTSGGATTTTSSDSSSTTLPPTTAPAPITTTAPPAEPTVAIEVTVTDGAVTGPERVKVALGDLIVLSVTADVADEVHFHGYDVFGDVAPGEPAVLRVEALIPGVFEVELEGARLELVLIEVE